MAAESGHSLDEPVHMIEIGRRDVISLSVYGVLLAFLSLAAATAVMDAHLSSAASAIGLLLAYVATLVVHELVHGVFFRLFGGAPKYGAGITHGLPYAYATSPGDRFLPHQMYQIAAAPLVLLTAAAVATGLLAPGLAAPAIVVVVGNVSGAVGDIWMMVQMRRFTSCSEVTFEDTRAGLVVYSHDPRATALACELRAAKESSRHHYVLNAVGATLVLMFAAVIVPAILRLVGASSDVVIGPDWFSLVEYRPTAGGFNFQVSLLPPVLGGIIFSLAHGWLRNEKPER